MCPAKVECPDGYSFILPADGVLDERIGDDFNHIPQKDQESLDRWNYVFGKEDGYEIFCEGRQQVTFQVTKKRITSEPKGQGRPIGLDRHGVFVLAGGTKISPVES